LRTGKKQKPVLIPGERRWTPLGEKGSNVGSEFGNSTQTFFFGKVLQVGKTGTNKTWERRGHPLWWGLTSKGGVKKG